MSNKEQAMLLLEKVPDYKMGYAIAFLQGLTVDEDTDDIFCEKLVQEYLNDTDPQKHDSITLDEMKAELGI